MNVEMNVPDDETMSMMKTPEEMRIEELELLGEETKRNLTKNTRNILGSIM